MKETGHFPIDVLFLPLFEEHLALSSQANYPKAFAEWFLLRTQVSANQVLPEPKFTEPLSQQNYLILERNATVMAKAIIVVQLFTVPTEQIYGHGLAGGITCNGACGVKMYLQKSKKSESFA